MSLRMRTLLLVGGALLGLVVAVWLAAELVVARRHEEIELDRMHRDVLRALDAVKEDLGELDLVGGDWGAWDETYAFVEDGNAAFVASNVTDTTFQLLDLDVVLVVHLSGRVVLCETYDVDRRQPLPCAANLLEWAGRDPTLRPDERAISGVKGILMLPGGPLLLAARPILHSNGAGPARGSVVMGRFLERRRVERIGRRTHLAVEFRRCDDPALPGDVRAVRDQLGCAGNIVVRMLDERTVAGYALLCGIDGKPALVARVSSPAEVIEEGRKAVRGLLLTLLVAGVVFGGAVLVVVERTVLARLARLSSEVSGIGADGYPLASVTPAGRDELGTLASAINRMLEALRRSHNQLEARVEARTAELARANEELASEVAERRAAEQERERLVRALEATAEVGSMLLAAPDPREVAPRMVETLGRAAGASRCRWFEVRPGPGGMDTVLQRAEWCGPGVAPGAGSPGRGELPLDRLPQLSMLVARGEIVVGLVRSMPSPDREYLESEGIHSLVVIPLMAGPRWSGFIGLHDCAEERVWSQREVHLLQAAAHAFELALERHEQRRRWGELAAVVEQATEAIMITDARGRITWVNGAFTRVSGYRLEELLGRNPRALMPHREGRAVQRQVLRTLAKGGSWQGVMVNPRQDGKLVHAQTTIFPLLDSHGGRVGYTAIGLDITDQLELEERVRRGEKLETLGQLAAGIAHDFNNLIMVILGAAELLQRRSSADDPLRAELETITRTAQRAANLSRGLLAISRRQPLSVENLDLDAVVEEALPMLRSLIPESIVIEHAPRPGRAAVRADRGQLEQVLINLCVNARDAMPGGGTLVIGTSTVTLDDEYLTAHPWANPGSYAVLSVADNGIGMDEETRARAFEPFFSTKAPGQGTGLGLATVLSIVRQHGGTVEIESVPERGTTVTVLLPLAEAGVGARREQEQAPAVGGRDRILLVEDHHELRAVVARLLESLGYHVEEAANGLEGLRRLEGEGAGFDLVMSDVVMPELGGLDLYLRIREKLPNTAFLFTSGYTADDRVFAELERPPWVGFLPKPYDLDVLARMLRHLIEARGLPHA